MKTTMIGLFFILISALWSVAQTPAAKQFTYEEQEIVTLSKDKWQWMADKNGEVLSKLFHVKAVFVHMGGAWGTEQEVTIINSGGIGYKNAEIHIVSVNIIDQTAILLNRIDLLAVIGGNEVTNPFMVTEVNIKQDGIWKLGSLSFTRLMTTPAPGTDSH